MTPLPSQEFFESLIKPAVSHEPIVMIRFGASWCGPCQRLDTKALLDLSPQITWYYCDLDENDYTPGYCPQPIFQSSDTTKVIDWMRGGFKKA